jgi:hypothetical protein
MAIGAHTYYCIEGVDGSGNLTGEWEVGEGTYSGANTLSRSVLISSAGYTACTFSAGTKRVFMTVPAWGISHYTGKSMSSPRNIFVRTDGNDGNTGWEDSAGGALATISAACDLASQYIHLGDVLVNIGSGTYADTQAIIEAGVQTGSSAHVLTFYGDWTTPSTRTLSNTANAPVLDIADNYPYIVALNHVRLLSSGGTGAIGIRVGKNARLAADKADFGACTGPHVELLSGAQYTATSSMLISGSSPCHIRALEGLSRIKASIPYTISNTPAFSSAFIYVKGCVVADLTGATYSGSATGKRYDVRGCSYVESGVTLPGGTAGTVLTGGQYL